MGVPIYKMNILKDKYNKVIGTVKTEGNTLRLTDRNNNTVGVYNKSNDSTYDRNQSYVGNSNQFLRLLK
jgi:hypothetical protein